MININQSFNIAIYRVEDSMKICELCNTAYSDSAVAKTTKCSCGGRLVDSNRYRKIHLQQNSIPKCPTCGSTNIRRITTFEKVGNVVAFGILGNKRKYQFECLNKNCKYCW